MRIFFVLIVITLNQSLLFSQSLPKNLKQANWQQKVGYKISVSLNEQEKSLFGFEQITYHNNSPDVLKEIYIHLWPNAYNSRTTAYAIQELENGNTKFHFADPSERGKIDSLDFKINGNKVPWHFTKNIDIAVITLNNPLEPGKSIEISTPFFVKLPSVFSRMGYEDSIFCITQWYPKPAVYDVNGWNMIPYLTQGEFYSEFGKFDVSINVPKEMLVAATGEIQDPKEKQWWLERSKTVKAKHFSEEDTKTLRFIQDSVHDFAWFGSRQFMADRSEVVLENGKTVETWIFGKPRDEKDKPEGVEFINQGVSFYSEKVGNYPYSIAQVVITPLKAGGGMEYPTITNCASNDETTIVHEVGHNWFYGILGSNERDHPWMDESFNTYYEGRQHRAKKEETTEKKGTLQFLIKNMDQSTLLFQYVSRKNIDQPGNLTSEEYTSGNYGGIVYAKNPLCFDYLQAYLGDEKMDALMHAYYEKWKFKHPLPNDFRAHAEEYTQENLSWFFDGLLGSTQKMDYKIKSSKEGLVKVKNIGSLNVPFPISIMNQDSVISTHWFKGFNGTQTLSLPASQATSENLIYRIDGENKTIDLYKQNNTSVVKGWCKTCSTIKVQPFANFEDKYSSQVFWAPVYAYNLYNKSMLGVAFYNSIFPEKKNEFVLMPLYSFETKDLNGYASYWHNFYTPGKIRNIQAGFKSARFASMGNIYNSGNLTHQGYIDSSASKSFYSQISYEKLAPFLLLHLQPKNRRSRIDQQILLRYVMVNEQAADRGFAYQFIKDHYGIANLVYSYSRKDALYPSTFNIQYEQGLHNSSLQKLGAEFKQNFSYAKKGKEASIRFFGGLFLSQQNGTGPELTVSRNSYERAMYEPGGNTGKNDYLYDESMIGRMAPSTDFWGKQVIVKDAGFRNFVDLGNSDSWMTAANVTVPFPLPVPIGLYADVSVGNLNNGSGGYGVQTHYVGGLYLQIFKDVAYWYVPIIQSAAVEKAWELNGMNTFFSKTSFVLNLNKINPIALLRDIKL